MRYLLLIVFILAVVIIAGCISGNQNIPSPPTQTSIPIPTTLQIVNPIQTPTPQIIYVTVLVTPNITSTPKTTDIPLLQQTTTANRTETITTNLPYGITISYPQDWILEETGVTVTRDYGRDVFNVANLYSPTISPERKMTGPNPDTSDNTVLTVDVDDTGVTDFEGYFNRVALALQDEYGLIDITSHDLQLKISGYKAYKMDFDTKDLRGKYLFTNVDGTVYIFAFSNPSPYSSEVEAMYRSIVISA